MTHHVLQMPASESQVRALRVGDTVTLEKTLFGIRDATLIAIEDAVETLDLDIDLETSGGILTLTFPNGSKVIITDTDHYAPGKGDALWAWKSFLRGHHPILMDFGIIAGVNPPDPAASTPGVPPYAGFEPARYAMGDTLHYAQKMDLLHMEPRGDLSSTGYVLANPGEEVLVLQPSESAEAFNVTLEAGTYSVEWFSVNAPEL